MAIFSGKLSSDGGFKVPSSGMEISFFEVTELGPANAISVGPPKADPFRREAPLRATFEIEFSGQPVLLPEIEDAVEELGAGGVDGPPPLKENPHQSSDHPGRNPR